MISPFLMRLNNYIGTPARRKLLPRKFEEFIWNPQQVAAGKRWFQRRKWHYINEERNAYAVSMHLLMRREHRRAVV